MNASNIKNALVLFFVNSALILFLAISGVVSLRTAMPDRMNGMIESFARYQPTEIKKYLDSYYQTQGHYPENLNDIPEFPHHHLFDPWGNPIQYERSDENGKYILTSSGYDEFFARNGFDEFRTQNRIRIIRHIIATGCMALLIFLILSIRRRKDGHWPTWKSLPLLLSFTIGFYARLGDNGLLPMGGSVFYALYATPWALAVLALVLAIIKRDSLYFAALIVSLYAINSVFILVA